MRLAPPDQPVFDSQVPLELHGVEIFGLNLVYASIRTLKMNNIVEDHGENRFANGQSSRDLRATLCGAELETQLIEAVDNVGDFLQSSRGEGA